MTAIEVDADPKQAAQELLKRQKALQKEVDDAIGRSRIQGSIGGVFPSEVTALAAGRTGGIVNDTIENIKNNKLNAEWALTETLDKFTKLFNNMNDDYLKAKKDDLDLVVHGIIRNLIGHSQEKLSEIDEPVILVAHTLSPSDTIAMPKNLVLGMVTEVGGKTSHVAIFASALGIPLIGGIKDLTA
ncbi:hypothetical protein IIC65_04420, partial [Candidatus Sumerlaeota bacterium]|nr:hypothetical protein [Candidatus Sumerlaeota bacterium]